MTRSARVYSACAAAVIMIALAASPSDPQEPARSAILPDTIAVGDVARVAVRVTVKPGSVVVFPDSLVLPLEIENAGDRTITVDTTAAGIALTATYAIAAWRPGSHALPALSYTVDGTPYTVSLDSLRIQSVLPADTAGIKPKPLKPVLGANRVWWPILALIAALLAIAAIVWYVRRRRRIPVAVPIIPRRPAREVALDRLERARANGHVERGDLKTFYSEISEAMREYVAAVDLTVTPDLTTAEAAAALRARGTDAAAVELLTLLGAADLVKFARRTPRVADAYAEWTRAQRWVADVQWPPVNHSDVERAA